MVVDTVAFAPIQYYLVVFVGRADTGSTSHYELEQESKLTIAFFKFFIVLMCD